ncbi:DUF3772 domain-containing protein [Ancylobacter amanitiformis]|uniref:Small-conductance mechanosensitive channel n=1 Tax=Ancylobacter amanitiformis TaxID=217069 RepID=A0ABU0LS34_9HYPH|nr:DUF3772 domain-containing protein [Ancylobacter amanitiformis]MDQ0511490.1 small-conductance mechanosensitive channel [Ancylobacter amanitiformis]
MAQRTFATARAIAGRRRPHISFADVGAMLRPTATTLILLTAWLCLALGMLAPMAAGAQAALPPEQQVLQDRLEGQRAVVDGVEAALGRDGLRSEDLDGLRTRLDPVRDNLSAGIAILDPAVADLYKRLQELGPKPAADAPPESESIARERESLEMRASALDGLLKQVRLINVRADQLSDRITSRRRALFTDTLLARSFSVLDPNLWISAVTSIPVEIRGIRYLLTDWRAYADARMSRTGQILVGLGALGIIALVVFLQNMFSRPLRRVDLDVDGEPLSPLKVTGLSALVAIIGMAAAPAATLAVMALLNAFDLVPPRVVEISQGVLIAVCILAVGRGLLAGALAPMSPRRRVVPVSDEMARLIYRNAALGLWIVATAVVLSTIHRALVAPVPLTVATAAGMALALVLVAGRTMRALGELADGPDADEGDEAKGDTRTEAKPEAKGEARSETKSDGGGPSQTMLQWIRFPFWVLNASIVAALVAGYVSVASYLASRSLFAVVLAGALYLIIALINAVFIDGIASGPRARHVAKTLGVRPASLELLALLVAGVCKALATVVVLVMVIGTFGTSTADVRDLVSRITFGFTIGTSTITLGDVLSAVMFLVVGIVIARAIQRWFAVAILPKTSFDQGLQNSISTIIGYVGSIAVVAMSMGQIGLNLQNIALVAGALSVGIGFGLQSIVSNFVSGLILLAERPIRVGDTISVKGEEGYVRRISVRATEIETFDRAAVVIPNSDLITGMVKNFTHANTTGRVIVAVNVAYDADADEVRDILIGCACDHPQVLRSPPPRVFLMAFGDSYLKFELRCVVANVDYALTVKSDLHFAVLDRMKAAHIGIPYTPWNIYRGGPIGTPPAAADD